MSEKINWQAIVELAKAKQRPIKTLIALAPQNDPFYAGAMPACTADAEWFAEHYCRFGFGVGCHLRRVHYRLISQEAPPLMRDGSPYENTEACWAKLCGASKPSRYLDLVPMHDLEDHRNPEPVVHLPEPVDEPEIFSSSGAFELSPRRELPTPSLILSADCPTPFHLEIWCEKSTVNDVLLPLASQYGLNVVTGVGELSLSACRDLVARAKANGGRPVRIFYVSDFDPGGQSMPVAVARKIEWFMRNFDGFLDIQLQPIALTHQQCIEFQLPRTPIKESERRAARFEQRFGEGATELDALEALYPGELRRILIAEIEHFLDPELKDRWDNFESDIQDALDAEEEAALAEYADERAALQARLDALREQAQELNNDLTKLNKTIRRDMMDRARPIIDDLDIPEPDHADEWHNPLFDSSRDYVEQIDAYKAFQGRPTERKKRGAAA